MKRVLGLDLGTTSIGWALVEEGTEDETSKIVKLGVRVVPLTTDEKQDFERGKPQSKNATRTLKRGARRNLFRYKLRREHLKEQLREMGFITAEDALAESGKGSTFELLALRAKAATEQVSKAEFARVLLAINKKRGYKSNRKAKTEEEGEAIDSMGIALELYENDLTPGQYIYRLLQAGTGHFPDFYRSDLQGEFDRIWEVQRIYYPDQLTDELYDNLLGKNKNQTWAICKEPFGLEGIKRTGKKIEQKKENYAWRVAALQEKMDLETLAIVLQEINNDINKSSGYLGAISDRSKELYFNKKTVGQYKYDKVKSNPHASLKNMVFYRQDYMDEFEKVWETQATYYPELKSGERKAKIRDTIIFHQRRLKSQKGLISRCEFEKSEIDVERDGKKKRMEIGPRVIPRSSPLFQHFKIWQMLNNLEFEHFDTREKILFRELDEDIRQRVFEELDRRSSMKAPEILKIIARYLDIDRRPSNWNANYESIEGNRTKQAFYKVYESIAQAEGYGFDWSKRLSQEVEEELKAVFEQLGIMPSILDFNPEEEPVEEQESYRLWHLIYSSEDDPLNIPEEEQLVYGKNMVKLKKKLHLKYGFPPKYAGMLANISLLQDYGSLSAKAIKRILPFLRAGHEYSEACMLAGYNHSNSKTKEEWDNRTLEPKMELLKKNSLRNPVVEKILNQMVHVVNQVIEQYGKPDEVRIELARELKASIKERDRITKGMNAAFRRHEEIRQVLRNEFGILNPTRNDIIRYKLYDELRPLGYHTPFTNRYIRKEDLFSKKIDIEHIIPKARLFDDSFSNKTLAYRDVNLQKGNRTAYDFISEDKRLDRDNYEQRVATLYNRGRGTISKAKRDKLLMKASEIPEDFIRRDLRDSQYIAKKAKELLERVIRDVNTTSGQITAKLREDWDLVNVMKELNMPKYEMAGMTYYEERKNGQQIKKIKDWTKRDDHRHHAMDALTVAFTTRSHVQYLNNLNALSSVRVDEIRHQDSRLYGIREKITEVVDRGPERRKKRRFKRPIPDFREQAKKHLESILVSHKAKNKVTTWNLNKIKGAKNPQKVRTPRGQLHQETVYGRIMVPEKKSVKIGSNMDAELISKVTKPIYRMALLERLNAYGGDPKKAFVGKNSLKKNPVIVEERTGEVLPEKVDVLLQKEVFTIRKPVGPDLKVSSVIDQGVKRKLEERLAEYGGKPKEAFADLETNPIWLNEPQGIAIKRVTIRAQFQGMSDNALHIKRDHHGAPVRDENGAFVPADFVNLGNNHHVAIYIDPEGKLQEKAVSFFEAVTRVNQGLPPVDKDYNADQGWRFVFTLKQNEMFIFPSEGFDPWDFDLKDQQNAAIISPHLFRVQKISTKNYLFTNHKETRAVSGDDLKNRKSLIGIKYHFIQSPSRLRGILKVRLNHLGQIVEVIGGVRKEEDRGDGGENEDGLVNEPAREYQSKRIRFSSSDEDKEDEIRYFQTHDLVTRLRHTVSLIRRAFGVGRTGKENLPLRIRFNQ